MSKSSVTLPAPSPTYRDEPKAKTHNEGLTTGQLVQALRWYEDNVDNEKLAKLVNESSTLVERFRTYFKTHRLVAQGFTLPHAAQASYLKLEQAVTEFRQGQVEKSETKMNKPKVDIQAATKAKAMPLLDKITVQFDKNLKTRLSVGEAESAPLIGPAAYNWYEFLTTLDIPGMYIPHLIQQIKDDDKKYSAYPALWDEVIADLEKVQASAVRTRKPRKKKSLNVEKLVGKLTFLKEDKKLKVTSINPEKIIGAQELWVYMVNRKYATHFVADGPNGLSLSGSTVKGFNAETSLRKKLRKPEEMIKTILESRSTKAHKELAALSTKQKEVSGRINEETLLLKVG